MRIEVYKDWIIRSDSMNIILCKSAGMQKYKEKDGTIKEREGFKEETYHRNIEQALDALCRKEIYACRATTLKGLQKCYTELKTLLGDISKQLGESEATEC
jgi:hypothetical protein